MKKLLLLFPLLAAVLLAGSELHTRAADRHQSEITFELLTPQGNLRAWSIECSYPSKDPACQAMEFLNAKEINEPFKRVSCEEPHFKISVQGYLRGDPLNQAVDSCQGELWEVLSQFGMSVAPEEIRSEFLLMRSP